MFYHIESKYSKKLLKFTQWYSLKYKKIAETIFLDLFEKFLQLILRGKIVPRQITFLIKGAHTSILSFLQLQKVFSGKIKWN